MNSMSFNTNLNNSYTLVGERNKELDIKQKSDLNLKGEFFQNTVLKFTKVSALVALAALPIIYFYKDSISSLSFSSSINLFESDVSFIDKNSLNCTSLNNASFLENVTHFPQAINGEFLLDDNSVSDYIWLLKETIMSYLLNDLPGDRFPFTNSYFDSSKSISFQKLHFKLDLSNFLWNYFELMFTEEERIREQLYNVGTKALKVIISSRNFFEFTNSSVSKAGSIASDLSSLTVQAYSYGRATNKGVRLLKDSRFGMVNFQNGAFLALVGFQGLYKSLDSFFKLHDSVKIYNELD